MPLAPELVSLLDCFSFGHVFPFFRSPVEMRAFLMVNMCLGVNPNLAVASARRGCSWWIRMNECVARAVAGPCPPAGEIAAPGLSGPVVCATLCPVDLTLGCLKWAAVGFVVAFALLKLFEASHLHDDIPKPAFKIRQTKRATLVLSTFAAMLSALVWLLVQKLD